MAQHTMEIPDEIEEELFDALWHNYQQPDEVDNPDFNPAKPESDSNPRRIPNPETKAAHARRRVVEFFKDHYVARQQAKARAEAAKAAEEIETAFAAMV